MSLRELVWVLGVGEFLIFVALVDVTRALYKIIKELKRIAKNGEAQ